MLTPLWSPEDVGDLNKQKAFGNILFRVDNSQKTVATCVVLETSIPMHVLFFQDIELLPEQRMIKQFSGMDIKVVG